MAPVLSPAARGLLRALILRSDVTRDRILLSQWTSVDWQSLTSLGERHEAEFRITGTDAAAVAARIANGLTDAEFAIPGQIVAEIALVGRPHAASDGATVVRIEALTVAE
jgi:hypothetical protein